VRELLGFNHRSLRDPKSRGFCHNHVLVFPITRDDGDHGDVGDCGYLTENTPLSIFLRIPVTNGRKLPFTEGRNSRRCFRCDLLGYFGVKLLELGARKDFLARRS